MAQGAQSVNKDTQLLQGAFFPWLLFLKRHPIEQVKIYDASADARWILPALWPDTIKKSNAGLEIAPAYRLTGIL